MCFLARIERSNSRLVARKKKTKAIIPMENIFEVHPFLNELKNQRDIIKAIIIPTKGARKIKLAVLIIIGELTAPKPPAAIAAPAKPPINVCEEEDGIPNHQVIRFQAIAAISPEKLLSSLCRVECDWPLLFWQLYLLHHDL